MFNFIAIPPKGTRRMTDWRNLCGQAQLAQPFPSNMGFEFSNWYWAAVQITLIVETTDRAEERELFLGFHAFSDYRKAKGIR